MATIDLFSAFVKIITADPCDHICCHHGYCRRNFPWDCAPGCPVYCKCCYGYEGVFCEVSSVPS